MPDTDFKLIETMLYDGGLKNPSAHISRLESSADYCDFKFIKENYISVIESAVDSLDGSKKYKIRILLHRDGFVEAAYSEADSIREKYTIAVSAKRTDSSNIYLRHKTTNRDLYNSELKKAREMGYFDAIFLNERDEITEGAITNIYIKKNGTLYTPPLSSGLLNGTIRSLMIRDKIAEEMIISLEDLENAESVYISNAIIEFREVDMSGGLKFSF